MVLPTLTEIITSISQYSEPIVIGIMFLITAGVFFFTVKIAFWFSGKESKKYEKMMRKQNSY